MDKMSTTYIVSFQESHGDIHDHNSLNQPAPTQAILMNSIELRSFNLCYTTRKQRKSDTILAVI